METGRKDYSEYEKIIKEVSEEEPQDIIDPEIPALKPEQELSEERFMLLQRVLGAVAAGKTVKGLTPAHFGGNTEAMLVVSRALRSAERRSRAV